MLIVLPPTIVNLVGIALAVTVVTGSVESRGWKGVEIKISGATMTVWVPIALPSALPGTVMLGSVLLLP